MFLGKGILKIYSKFTGKHLCRSAISIELQSNFIEITLRHGFSPVNLLHIFRTPFPNKTPGLLLLTLAKEKKVLVTDEAVVQKLSSYFEIIVQNVDLQNKADNVTNEVLKDVIRKFENHSRIMKIKENIDKCLKVSLSLVIRDNVEKNSAKFSASWGYSHNKC